MQGRTKEYGNDYKDLGNRHTSVVTYGTGSLQWHKTPLAVWPIAFFIRAYDSSRRSEDNGSSAEVPKAAALTYGVSLPALVTASPKRSSSFLLNRPLGYNIQPGKVQLPLPALCRVWWLLGSEYIKMFYCSVGGLRVLWRVPGSHLCSACRVVPLVLTV